MFRAAREVAGRFAGAAPASSLLGASAADAGAGRGFGSGDAARLDAPSAHIDTAIDIPVSEGVPHGGTMRGPWIAFVPRRPAGAAPRATRPTASAWWGDRYVLQGAPGTIILGERAACVVPGGTPLHPAAAFHCPHPRRRRPPRVLDPDGPRYGARGGAGAAKARRRAYIAAGLQAITVPTPEYPLGTRTGMLQKAARQRLRPASRRGRRQRPPAAAAAAAEPTSCSRTSFARRRACRWTRPWRRAHRARPARRSRPAPCGCRCPSPCGS